jgi:hypothetical protein
MTRTHLKNWRVYCDGVDISGYARSVGALSWMFDAEPDAALTDAVKNILIGKGDIQAGPINAFLDNDAAGLFALAGTGANDHGTRLLTAVVGANAAPVAGDHVFSWKFEQTNYLVEQGTGFVAATVTPGGASYASTLTYKQPWGRVLSPKQTWIAASTAVGIDDNAGSSALGGIFIYHLFSSDGTVTLKVQDAATNTDGNFSDLSGATSGSITAASTPQSGMVALSTTATVRRYLRAQISLGTASTLVAFMGFIRNYLP